ncbi:hypothetical protein IP88_04850 [alpha proteobacterium AAP81b]|nr:hypothetical protein IP88_04850 [alpha proteobacterium AAP81b]
MKIVHEASVPWGGSLPHRGSGVLFKDLLVGDDGPENYLLALVKIDDSYQTPRHRHNFDQVRVMLEGGFGFGDQVQDEGSIGYFGEGTAYEQKSIGPNVHLLLQCANASRAAYFGRDTLRRGNQELQRVGRFENGVFSHRDADGRLHNKDGFEAVWEHLAGEPVRYQPPRYERPVIFYPDRFAAVPVRGAPGVTQRHFGSFSERCLALAEIGVVAGATAQLGTADQRSLYYALAGTAEIAGTAVVAGAALGLAAGETASAAATDDLRLLEFRLPR